MNTKQEIELLDSIINFCVPVIPETTRFWMIRTQKGFFYNEFLSRKYVALAWNNIDCTTDFAERNKDYLKDDIMMEFPEIHRPSTVINKCLNFIKEIKVGDILIIPSRGSQYITFAIAGEYFEDSTKTLELEKTVISRIKNNDIDIADVSCPYKKRRHINILRTIKCEDVSLSLYRALSNYHGISNLDAYSYQILSELYNCYTFKENTVLVYNIRKSTPIRPRELSNLIYGNIESLCKIVDEESISTQMALHSPGDAIYFLKDMYKLAVDNWEVILGLLVILGGGKAFSFEIHGLVDIVSKALSTKEKMRADKIANDTAETELHLKRLELVQKLRDSGIDPESLVDPLKAIVSSTQSLKTEPIVHNDSVPEDIISSNAGSIEPEDE